MSSDPGSSGFKGWLVPGRPTVCSQQRGREGGRRVEVSQGGVGGTISPLCGPRSLTEGKGLAD